MRRFLVNNFPGWKFNTELPIPNTTTRNFLKKAFAVTAFFLFLPMLFGNQVFAATFTVNTLADTLPDTCAIGNCTLREAIIDANSLPGDDIINFQTGGTGTITLTRGNLLITQNVDIVGPGARAVTVSGNNNSRVFVISGIGVTANISGLTVTGGNAVPILIGATFIGDGGGILNANGATLNLTEMNISGNAATSLGGGVATRAILGVTTTTNISRCLISGNSAVAGGGGISNLGTVILSSAVTTITNTTVTSNTTLAEGGGISNTGGTMNLTNNTISHNESVAVGGGIVNVAGALVGIVNVRNTIIAQNNAVVGLNLISSDGLGIFNSLGNNLVGNNLDIDVSFMANLVVGGVLQPQANGDIVGSVEVGFQIVDPLLDALQNNGGLTNTRALLTGSPALDRANNCVFTNTCPINPSGNNPPFALLTDQRGTGFTRLGNLTVDIGAYEAPTVVSAASVSVGGKVSTPDGNGISNATVMFIDSAGIFHSTRTNSFGYFSFIEVKSGETYVMNVQHRRYTFAPKIVTVTDSIKSLHLVSN